MSQGKPGNSRQLSPAGIAFDAACQYAELFSDMDVPIPPLPPGLNEPELLELNRRTRERGFEHPNLPWEG